jgi:hypothetical protein
MSLAAPMFTNHPICDSIRSSAATKACPVAKKAIFENGESDQSVARLANANFGLDALRQRKEAFITPEQAADYVKEKHEITAADVRQLRKEVDAWRRIYAPVYGEIRHHLAHNKGARQDLDALLAKTNIEEMKKMFAFLHALHEALRELHRRHRARLAELFREGLAVAAAEGRGMVLARRSQDDDHSARRQAAWWGRNGRSWPQD